jgi:hypothetical protein
MAVYGYTKESVALAMFLIKHRSELVRDYLSFKSEYSNQDFDMMQDLACWLTHMESQCEVSFFKKEE